MTVIEFPLSLIDCTIFSGRLQTIIIIIIVIIIIIIIITVTITIIII